MKLLLILGSVVSVMAAKLKVLNSTVCEDEYEDCRERAEQGECHGGDGQRISVALAALAECRVSCRDTYTGVKDLPRIVKEAGGLEDVGEDVFGEEVAWCDLAEGLDRVMRYSLLRHKVTAERVVEWVPRITDTGIHLTELPTALFGMLNIARTRELLPREDEPCVPEISCFNCQQFVEVRKEGECRVRHSKKQEMIPLGVQLKDTMLEAILPMAEQWAGIPLISTSLYGIRRYKRGAWLKDHVDRFNTHVISATVNIGHKGKPWPLQIFDHQGNLHKVVLAPGEMLFYEGARLRHGRPTPLDGEFSDYVFLHFKPTDRKWYRQEVHWDLGEVPKRKVTMEVDPQTGKKTFHLGKPIKSIKQKI